jgi:hypothetical protein
MATAALMVVLMGTMCGVPMILHYRNEAKKRELEHIERLKAIEFGRTLPQDERWWSPGWTALVIGAGVPIGVFLCVLLASTQVGYHEQMWIGASSVGISSVICGTILAFQSSRARKLGHDPDAGKPEVEEDAYDVVASRG